MGVRTCQAGTLKAMTMPIAAIMAMRVGGVARSARLSAAIVAATRQSSAWVMSRNFLRLTRSAFRPAGTTTERPSSRATFTMSGSKRSGSVLILTIGSPVCPRTIADVGTTNPSTLACDCTTTLTGMPIERPSSGPPILKVRTVAWLRSAMPELI